MLAWTTTDMLDTDLTSTLPLHDEVLGYVTIEANVPLSMAVEQQLVKRLRELYPDGVGVGVYEGTVLDVTCHLMMRHYQAVSYRVTRTR